MSVERVGAEPSEPPELLAEPGGEFAGCFLNGPSFEPPGPAWYSSCPSPAPPLSLSSSRWPACNGDSVDDSTGGAARRGMEVGRGPPGCANSDDVDAASLVRPSALPSRAILTVARRTNSFRTPGRMSKTKYGFSALQG